MNTFQKPEIHSENSLFPFAGSKYAAGKAFFCVHRGTSMNPTLNSQDLLEIKPYHQKKPAVGDVVFFQQPGNGFFVVHRIIKISRQGMLSRGDNNGYIDPWVLNPENICGQVVAAYRGNTRRRIANGLMGKATGCFYHLRRKTPAVLTKTLRPAYRSLCSGGLLHRIIPVRLQPRVASFQTGGEPAHRLLLGKRVIGTYDSTLLKWQIRRPYRLFLDESSLPLLL